MLLRRPESHNNTFMRDVNSRLFAAPLLLALLAVAACTNGGTVVTMTATASSDPFIVYRVGLTSVQLKTSGGKTGFPILPAETSVDFTKTLDLSEVLGAANSLKFTSRMNGIVVRFRPPEKHRTRKDL